MRAYARHFLFFLTLLLGLTVCTSSFSNQLPVARELRGIEGTLEIRAANFLKQNADRSPNEAIQYVLKTNENTYYYLIFTDHEPTNLKTGQRIKVKTGVLREHADGSNELFVTEKNIQITKNISLKELPDAFGKQKTIVMLVNFQDQPTNKPWTADNVKNTVFTTVNNMFSEFSYQQASVVGNVAGWFTIPLNSTASCSEITNVLPSLAQNAATQSGVDLSLYNRYIYMFPFNNNCSWAGLGSVGGKQTRTWINGFNMGEVIGHELGHNIGLYHAHSLECQGAANTGSCRRLEYGDLSDTMGYGYTYIGPHFNAFQKERLGWLNFTTSPPIQTVTASGTYTIDAFETNNRNVKALKVLKRKNTSSNDYYYLEFRQPIGFDQYFGKCTDCDLAKGVLVHQGNSINANSSESLDMSPQDGNKNKLVTLTPGNSFRDSDAPNGGVTFKVESISSAGAKVTVTFGNAPPPPTDCKQSAPTLEIMPGYITIKPGQTARYNVFVVNNDSVACPASVFNVAINKINDNIPVTWTPASAFISPGGTAAVTVTAAPTVSTPTGYYSVRINTVNASNSSMSAFVVASLDVRN